MSDTANHPVVRAKFYVQSITPVPSQNPDDKTAHVSMYAVYGNGEANKDWSRWTPSGSITMSITNPSAVEKFEVGKEYFVDFTPA